MRDRSNLVPPLTTLLVGAVLVVATRAAWPAAACGPGEVAAQGAEQGGPEVVHVKVTSSSNKGGLMKEMACLFERTAAANVGAHPVDVWIDSEASGATIDKIGTSQPEVWSPASSSWVRMLRQQHPDYNPASPWPSVAVSPQVIAMPRPIADALGWPDDPLAWEDVLELATDPGRWQEVAEGHPGWGGFKLGKTNLLYSTSGLNATAATFTAATEGGSSSDLTTDQLEDANVLDFVRGVESSVVHYAPTSVEFLKNLRTQDEQGNGEGYVSAILLEEKSVWDYNQGNPSGDPATLGDEPPPETPLAAFYPAEGALMADHPYVILNTDWVTADERAGAQAFLRFLEEPAQQERFQALGFRSRTGEPGSEIGEDNGLLAAAPEEIAPPGGDVLLTIRDAWDTYRKRARVLILVDVSGSMNETVPGTGGSTKLDLAQTAALQAIDEFGPDDEVGLWTFSPGLSSEPPFVEEVPIGRVSSSEERLASAIQSLAADGEDTELYATIEAAAEEMRAGFDGEKINGIILLSDGQNEGSTVVDREDAIGAVALEPDREVRVFTIAYGDAADEPTLEEIAHSSQGTAYDASDPLTIQQVFEQVVANF